MAGQIWQNGKDAVRICVHDCLFAKATTFNAPATINLHDELRKLLLEDGAPSTLADENAERWLANLIERTEEQLLDWDKHGLSRPFQWLNQRNTCVTWSHPQYLSLTGLDPLPPEFARTYEWIRGLREEEMLFVAICMAHRLGAQPILVADGTGDGGIDVVARVPHGPLRSTLLAIQCKTQEVSLISKQVVLAEFGKYMISCRDGTMNNYLRTAELGNSVDGTSIIYLFAANTEFDQGAREAARQLGILLRSARQLAHLLSSWTTHAKLSAAMTSQKRRLRRDLSTDLSPMIATLL